LGSTYSQARVGILELRVISSQDRYAAALPYPERKKRHTRLEIARAATALFEERGFDNVAVAEIAATADVSPKALVEYFSDSYVG
jgi:hypothetical protein